MDPSHAPMRAQSAHESPEEKIAKLRTTATIGGQAIVGMGASCSLSEKLACAQVAIDAIKDLALAAQNAILENAHQSTRATDEDYGAGAYNAALTLFDDVGIEVIDLASAAPTAKAVQSAQSIQNKLAQLATLYCEQAQELAELRAQARDQSPASDVLRPIGEMSVFF